MIVCRRCRRREAVASRRTISSIGTWNRPESVCEACRGEFDAIGERCSRGAISGDGAVPRPFDVGREL